MAGLWLGVGIKNLSKTDDNTIIYIFWPVLNMTMQRTSDQNRVTNIVIHADERLHMDDNHLFRVELLWFKREVDNTIYLIIMLVENLQ